MFTGIIEEIGHIQRWQMGADRCRLHVRCDTVLEGTKIGDSIAVNGVCLTVAEKRNDSFTADIMRESLRRTALSELGTNVPVNLERALQVGARLGGHWVTGHIDGVATIKEVRPESNAVWYGLVIAPELERYTALKGSIAVDGTSLTIARIGPGTCEVSLVPHTRNQSVLARKRLGDRVNIEVDVLARYIVHSAQHASAGVQQDHGLSEAKLKDLGFI